MNKIFISECLGVITVLLQVGAGVCQGVPYEEHF